MPKKFDYQIRIQKGVVADGLECYRVVVNTKTLDYNKGFGATPKEATDDFIRRNESELIDKIFDSV